MKTVHYLLILTALSSVIFFTQLGGMALTDPDETFYAQTAKEMLDDDNWVTPRIFGEPQYEKPVLYYWLIMAPTMSAPCSLTCHYFLVGISPPDT